MRQTEDVTPKMTLAILVFCFLIWGLVHKLSGEVGGLLCVLFPDVVGVERISALASIGGYCLAALPAVFFNWHVTYKAGVMLGLFFVVVGSLAFYPATLIGSIDAFAFVFLLQAFGLCFVEMSANTYALSMGNVDGALYRLSLGQCFNSLGWAVGYLLFVLLVSPNILGFDASQRLHMSSTLVQTCREADFQVIMQPYIWIGVVTAIVIVMVGSSYFSVHRDWDGWQGGSLGSAISSLLFNWRYVFGCVAQFLYVGAQTCCVASLPSLAREAFSQLDGISAMQVVRMTENCVVISFLVFFIGRVFFTWKASRGVNSLAVLRTVSVVSFALLLAVVLGPAMLGVVAVIAVCFCFAVMFPIIFAHSLRGFNAAIVKVGAAGQMFAFAGGIVLNSMREGIADSDWGSPVGSESVSFLVPALACLGIALFAHQALRERL